MIIKFKKVKYDTVKDIDNLSHVVNDKITKDSYYLIKRYNIPESFRKDLIQELNILFFQKIIHKKIKCDTYTYLRICMNNWIKDLFNRKGKKHSMGIFGIDEKWCMDYFSANGQKVPSNRVKDKVNEN